MAGTYDVLVIGAGHNGLVCGAYLAQAGFKVAVLERAPRAGGCIVSQRPAELPGFTLDLGGLEHGQLWGSRVVADLALERHGLRLLPRPVVCAGLFAGGRVLTISQDLDATCAAIERFCPADAVAYRRFVAASAGVLDLLTAANAGPPPSWSTLLRLGTLLPHRARLDACLRLGLQSAQAVLDTWFESPELKGLIGNFVTHHQLPPGQCGTGFLAALFTGVHRSPPARPRGGSSAFIASLLACLGALGADVLTGRGVAHVLVERGRVAGVRLEDGERLQATRAVVSSIDARRLFLQLMAPEAVPPALRAEARRIRVAANNVGEMSLGVALAGLPDFGPELTGASLGARVYQAASVQHIEDAFHASGRGELPARPTLIWALPSLTDPTLAPSGAQTLWVATYVPWQLRDGRSWDEAKEEMAERTLAALAEHAPGLPGLVRGQIVLSPLDWARRTGNLAGSGDHVDMTVDQLFGARPSPLLAGYRTPIQGLYLTGAGTHPGGGISGLPGRNTARVVLQDLGALGWGGTRGRAADGLARGRTALRGWRALDRLVAERTQSPASPATSQRTGRQ
jgi:beta-carotene ketolase (CrtO type)